MSSSRAKGLMHMQLQQNAVTDLYCSTTCKASIAASTDICQEKQASFKKIQKHPKLMRTIMSVFLYISTYNLHKVNTITTFSTDYVEILRENLLCMHARTHTHTHTHTHTQIKKSKP